MSRESIVKILAIGGWWSVKKIRENLQCSFQAAYDGLDAAMRADDVEERITTLRINNKTFKVREYKKKEG